MMAPSTSPRSDGSDTIGKCALLKGNPCSLCEQHIALEPKILQAKALVSAAEKVLHEVQAQQQLIRTRINQSHDKFSQIPAEIMTEIFKATLRREVRAGMESHVIDSPLSLGAVCQRWRSIAWSTPSLWNWIHVFLCLPPPKHLEELVKEWLDRSGMLPLTIQISCGKGVVDSDNPDLFFPGEDGIFGNFVDHINDCSPRWKNISFTVPCTIISFLYGSLEGAPNLEALRVNTTDGPFYHFRLEKLVRPSRIAFGSYPFTWDEVEINWTNIVDLHLSDFDTYFCIKAIEQMPRLTRCAFIDVRHEVGLRDLVSDQLFVHENLEELTFKANRNGLFEEPFFDHFVFPNLTRLSTLHGPAAPDLFFFSINGQRRDCFFLWENSIKPFLIRSGSALSFLYLQVPCQQPSLIEALEETGSLRGLHLDDCFDQDQFYCYSFLGHLANTWLAYPDEEDSSSPKEFLPDLEFFSYKGSLSVPNNGKPAFSAILDAFGPPSEIHNPYRRPLDHIVVRSSPIQVTKKNLRRLGNLCDAGMTLRLVNSRTGKDMI